MASSSIHSYKEVIDFLQRVFGPFEWGSSNNIQFTCPKCLEWHRAHNIPFRKKKLAISLDKNLIFHCWNCSFQGQIFYAIKKYYPGHIKEYIDCFSEKKLFYTENDNSDLKNDYLQIPNDYKLLATNLNSENSEIKMALKYAKERGITNDDLWKYKIGISNQWPWVNRLLFPSFDSEGNFNYLIGRTWNKKEKFKYWNLPIHSSKIIFNEINIDWFSELALTEGVFDLVKCDNNAVPLLGSDLFAKGKLFENILKFETPILLAIDKDAKFSKMPKIASLLYKHGIKINIFDHEKNDLGEMKSKEEFQSQKNNVYGWDDFSKIKNRIESIKL